ncbi:S-adenosyl-L-methionine-dependent methyltransferase [Sparassis latifolia]
MRQLKLNIHSPSRRCCPRSSPHRVRNIHPARFFSSTPSASTSLAPQLSPESSVNPDEIAHFSRLSSLWWDERGEFYFLHKMNPVRMQFIREKLVEMSHEDDIELSDATNILNGLDVLDVGCGGGLLSESLARLGASTLGIDASPSNIAIASLHASADPQFVASPVSHPHHRRLAYEHISIEELLARRGPKQFDVVCSMEVLEHVDNPSAFLRDCAQLVKPGGHLFLSTISRSPLAYLLTIFAAEHVLGLIAKGTHTYSKFVRPEELLAFFQKHRSPLTPTAPIAEAAGTLGCPWISRLYGGVPARTEAETRGVVYTPWQGQWKLVPRGAPGAALWGEACNYLFWVRRPVE